MTRTSTGQPGPAQRWEWPENNVWVWRSPQGVITLVAEADRAIIWQGPAVAKVFAAKVHTREGVPAKRFIVQAKEWAEARFAGGGS